MKVLCPEVKPEIIFLFAPTALHVPNINIRSKCGVVNKITLNLFPTLMNPSFLLPTLLMAFPNDIEPMSFFLVTTPGNRLFKNASLLSCISSSRSLCRASLSFSINSAYEQPQHRMSRVCNNSNNRVRTGKYCLRLCTYAEHIT